MGLETGGAKPARPDERQRLTSTASAPARPGVGEKPAGSDSGSCLLLPSLPAIAVIELGHGNGIEIGTGR